MHPAPAKEKKHSVRRSFDFSDQVYLEFTKMEGAGNDYVYLDLLNSSPVELSAAQIKAVSDRHFGAGSDGLVEILPSSRADALMRMWNADGSESSMCGNALRCVAYFVGKKLGKSALILETKTGLHQANILSDAGSQGMAEVAIAEPVFAAAKIPVIPEKLGLSGNGPFFDFDVPGVPGASGSLVSMGNPHLVVFVPEPDEIDLPRVGHALEHHEAFPERTNVEFVRILPGGSLKQRTWERGSGETLSCGSGICAVLAAAHRTARSPARNTVYVRGGKLSAEWKEDGIVYLTGPARIVYEGRITVD